MISLKKTRKFAKEKAKKSPADNLLSVDRKRIPVASGVSEQFAISVKKNTTKQQKTLHDDDTDDFDLIERGCPPFQLPDHDDEPPGKSKTAKTNARSKRNQEERTDGASEHRGSNKNVVDNNEINNVNDNSIKSELPCLSMTSSTSPIVKQVICDKLSITMNMPINDYHDILDRAGDLTVEIEGHYALTRKSSGQTPYDLDYSMKDHEGNHVALFQFAPKKRKAKYARLEFNPAEVGEKGIREILRILKTLIGPNYQDHLGEGNITRLDATVDINKLRPADLMIFSNRQRTSSLWKRSFDKGGHEEWTTETQCLGSHLSDYFAKVYDKAVQVWKIKGTIVNELITRIEVSFSPRGRNGKALQVKDIWQIKNPFAPINVAYYPAPDDKDPWFEFFVHAARAIGTEEALRKIKDRNKRALYRSKLLDHAPDWWHPDVFWQQFLDYLKQTRLLPNAAFQNQPKKVLKRF